MNTRSDLVSLNKISSTLRKISKLMQIQISSVGWERRLDSVRCVSPFPLLLAFYLLSNISIIWKWQIVATSSAPLLLWLCYSTHLLVPTWAGHLVNTTWTNMLWLSNDCAMSKYATDSPYYYKNVTSHLAHNLICLIRISLSSLSQSPLSPTYHRIQCTWPAKSTCCRRRCRSSLGC